MDFFGRQEQAQRRTRWLLVYFILATALMVVSIYAVVLGVFVWTDREQALADRVWWRPDTFLIVALGTVGVVLFGSLFKSLQLSRGGSAVAEMLGGRLIDPGTADLHERKLLNVIEEMSIASGTAMPAVYVMDDESSINAFAAGHKMDDAAIGVTRGTIERLNRDELQGVMAHEFSHIHHGDMRLNLRLMGLIFGILCISVIGRILLQSGMRSSYRMGARERKGGNPLPLLGLALMVIGAAGVFFGRLIQAAVSRQREFLADASAVQFTRNPVGLAGALKKIGASAGSRIASPHAAEAGHLFFGDGSGSGWFHLLATHPPLVERIRAIEPTFDGTFDDAPLRAAEVPTPSTRAGSTRMPGMGTRPFPIPPILPVQAVLAHAGNPTAAHLTTAATLIESLPDALLGAAREPYGAMAVIYGFLGAADHSPSGWAHPLPRGLEAEVQRLGRDLGQLEANQRLPLIEITLGTLRHLSREQYEEFQNNVAALIMADQQVDLFEFALQKILDRHLAPYFEQRRPAPTQYYALAPLLPDAALLLSALARAGETDPIRQLEAANAGMEWLKATDLTSTLTPGITDLDRALTRMTGASDPIKGRLLEACARTVAADGKVQPAEAELLRAIADALGVPIPPAPLQ